MSEYTPGPWTYEDGFVLGSNGEQVADFVPLEPNGRLIASAPQLAADNATLRALLREAHERLGTITELAYKSGADDLRGRIRAALETEP